MVWRRSNNSVEEVAIYPIHVIVSQQVRQQVEFLNEEMRHFRTEYRYLKLRQKFHLER